MGSAHSKFQSTSAVTPIRSIHCNFDAKLKLCESRHNKLFFFFFKEWWFGELSSSSLLSFWSACIGLCLTQNIFKYISFHHIFIMEARYSEQKILLWLKKTLFKGIKTPETSDCSKSWDGGHYSGPRTLETITPSYWPHGLISFLLRLKFILKTSL